MFAGAVAEDGIQLFVRHSLAVWAVAGHCVDRVGHRDDSGEERRFLGLESGRVAGTIPSFVVMADDRHHFIELFDAIENAAAKLGVRFDVLEFGRR